MTPMTPDPATPALGASSSNVLAALAPGVPGKPLGEPGAAAEPVAPKVARSNPRRKGPRKTVPAPVKGKKTAKANPAAPARDAARLLEGLHSSWRSALEAHRLRVEGQFRVVQGALAAPKRPNAKELERLRAAVKVHLKPRKGRAKDLRRVEDALDKALSRLRD